MKFISVAMLAMSLSMVACKKEPVKEISNVESFEKLVNEYYAANGIEATADVVKEKTLRGGSWIVIQVTYPGGEVSYFAGNLANYKPGMTIEELLAAGWEEAGAFPYTTVDGTVVPGIYADSQGNLYEQTSATSKDLEKAAAFAEAVKLSKASEKLASEFGLSEERSLKVAKLLNNFSKISQSRAMTTADANNFTKELLGTDYASLIDAVKAGQEGNGAAIEKLLEKAATVNGISPEHMSEIVSEILN